MMKLRGLMAALLLLLGCDASDAPPVEILHADMGFFDDQRNKGFVRSTSVPLRNGQRYGWFIELRTNKEKVSYIEQVNLSGPATWGVGNPSTKYEITPDRRGISVHRESAVRNGMIYGIWTITADDPPGTASFKVLIEGKVEHQFQFALTKQ